MRSVNKKWLIKIFAIVLLFSAVTTIAVVIGYQQWRQAVVEPLKANSQLINTAKGVIEYTTAGNKSTEKNHLLVLHGTPGGYDAAAILTQWLELDDDTHVILPSRPGYLRTPIATGITPKAAADAMVALLDKLNITKTTVLGWSGGALTALALAQHYPQRVNGLALLSPRAIKDDQYRFSSTDEAKQSFDPSQVQILDDYWGADFKAYAQKFALQFIPQWLLAGYFSAQLDNLELTIERLSQLSDTTMPPSLRQMGLQNDYWQFAALASEPHYDIKVPTLVIHSPIDQSVAFAHGQYLSRYINNAQLYAVAEQSHFSTMNAQAVGRFHTFLERLRQ